MKFTDYTYEHIDVDQTIDKLSSIEKDIKNASNFQELKTAFYAYDQLNRHTETMYTLVSIRHTIDTNDEFYNQEQDFFNESMPLIQASMVKVEKALLESPYLDELKKEIPETYFMSKEMDQKCFDECIIEDLQTENKLTTKYQSVIASAQIPFDGETYTLAGLEVKTNDKDRNVRKRAMKAYWGWFEEHNEEIGEIYDNLVQTRTTIAKKLGFENYIELGYLRMKRYDYDQKDVENYRKQVLDDVVPFDSYLYERQRKRLGYDVLQAWDEKIEFLSGNPKPKYDRDEMVKRALHMYQDLHEETKEFFEFMVEHDLLDLDSKKGKAAGGYCTFIPEYESPFIFANFNQTSHDAEVLTHEAGHAFQVYSSKNIMPLECMWPTYESCEIHSMSMEFFTYPYMRDFFEEDVDKYYFNHLSGAVKFLPYGVLVDHFQHEVYAHPEMKHKERMATWRRLEKQYLPHKNYEEIEILENGGWWLRQPHIFMDPFYYIDYTLAQVCALQFWSRIQDQDSTAFDDYRHICKIGGTKTFRQIVQAANLKVPFESGCLKDTMKSVASWFDRTEDPE